MEYKTINPFTSENTASYSTISNEELEVKLALASHAFQAMGQQTFMQKSEVLCKVAALLWERKVGLSKTITEEMGKPVSQSLAEVEKCAWLCDYYADNAEAMLQPREMTSTAKKSMVCYDPLGIILAVMPWNFPFWQVFRFAAPCLMAGNVGLLKHASNVPKCALAIEELFEDAGALPGFFQNLFVDYAQVEYLIKSPLIAGVTLTGSNFAGQKVAGLAGAHIKKSVLELGGSDPFIVFSDADFEGALENALASRFQNTGQSCISAKRFFVQQDIFKKFTEAFVEKVKAFKIDNPLNPETYIGPLSKPQIAEELKQQVDKSLEMGAKLLCGGKMHANVPGVFEPAVLVDVPLQSPVMTEETFGPVAPLVPFKTEEEAILLANQTNFGLGAALWTSDMDKAQRLVPKINAGTVVVNGMVKSEPSLPFGGIKDSGYGRELSDLGLYEFVNIKTVNYF